ncbi:hypothetical protein C0Q70_03018 [Pomacea canaliculata]|uniref:Uncharacterized protein n=1 Tax=Pomacea canaliculata TaxID=400727 RepID=A0A2T7PRK0_POMCA|nr:hypothetical protein C0Q70_03018 [Pomacea canaliculata]
MKSGWLTLGRKNGGGHQLKVLMRSSQLHILGRNRKRRHWRRDSDGLTRLQTSLVLPLCLFQGLTNPGVYHLRVCSSLGLTTVVVGGHEVTRSAVGNVTLLQSSHISHPRRKKNFSSSPPLLARRRHDRSVKRSLSSPAAIRLALASGDVTSA